MQNNTFRLFISSTFSDFTEERAVLQKDIFPEIESFCESYGYQFQPIDLRWGVNEEAQLDQKTLEVCLEEVKNCKIYPHPNFLIMSGDRYGWVPLPYAIEKNEFEEISSHVKDKKYLDEWYELDYNQLQASYILKKRYGKYIEFKEWEEVENILRDTLQKAVNNSNLKEKQKKKYFLSATEHEVVEGIFEYMDLSQHQKKLLKLNNKYLIDSKFVFGFLKNTDLKTDDNKNITNFKENIKNTLLEENLLERHSKEIDYLEDFKDFVLNKLKIMIEKQITANTQINTLDKEILEQNSYLEYKQKLFIGRKNDKKIIHNYIQNNSTEPLIIHGTSGLGKSSLIAKIISELKNKGKSVIFRFIGATPTSSDTKSTLLSIYKEITKEDININISLEDLGLKFYQFLNEYNKNLILIIDAVDQFSNKDSFNWLPKNLPNNIKIIITVLKDSNYIKDSQSYYILNNYHTNQYPLTPFEIDNNTILNMLKEENRTLTSTQLKYVSELYLKVKSPLYLKILIEEVKHWKSNDEKYIMEETQKGIIKEYIKNLELLHNHKSEFIEKVMSYIYSSQYGLSEKELLDFLSMDKKFLNLIAPQKYHTNYSNKIPISIWARLQFQVKNFMVIKNIDNIPLLQFFHREFNDAIKELFKIELFHKELIDFSLIKIKKQKYSFNKIRIGKLYAILIVSYAINYNNNSLEKHLNQLVIIKDTWINDFLDYLIEFINNYIQSGLIVEAKLIATSIYSNKKIFTHVKDKYNFLFLMGEIEQNQSLTDNAIKFYKNAIKNTHDEIKISHSNIQIAKTLRHSGKTKEARKILLRLLEDTLIEGSIEKADAMIQVGLCEFAEENFEKAYDYYSDADKYIVQFTDNRKLKLYNWLGISTVFASLNKVKEGLDLLYTIKKESQQYGYQNFYMDSLNGIAKKYLILEEYYEAKSSAEEALKLGQKQKNLRICYLMNGYIVESLAGILKLSKNNKDSIINEAQIYLDEIDKYNNKNLVKENLLKKLVKESIDKWNSSIV